jgi:hypothetical protein
MYTHAFTKKSPRLYKSYLVENLPFFTGIFEDDRVLRKG